MTNDETPRLCGGTYFTLLLESRRQRMGKKDSLTGKTDGLSEPETLLGLARVVMPDINEPLDSMQPTIKGNTFDFKSCKNYGGGFFQLGDKDARQAFDERVKCRYSEALNAMQAFVDQFIEVGGSRKKDVKLVRALLDLIDQDDSIKEDQLFYICEDGNPIEKDQICSGTHFCLDSFLLGVWHYALLRPEGNEIGNATYEEWCPPRGGAPREYQGSMGENLNREITIFRHVPVVEGDLDEDLMVDREDESEHSYESTDDTAQPRVTEQNINDPVVFQFNMYGDNGTQIGNVKHYHAPRKEDHGGE